MKLKSVLSVLVLSMAAASVFAAPSEINIAYVKAPVQSAEHGDEA